MQTASRPRTAESHSSRPTNRPKFWAFLLLSILVPMAGIFAQTGTADGTYNFASLGASESGGSGFKTQQDKFIVSNVFVQASTRMYTNNSVTGASQFAILKANNTTVKTFTLKNMQFQNAGATNYSLSRFDITLKDYSGNTIASHTLSTTVSLNTSSASPGPVSMSTFPFVTPWPVAGYPNVNSVEITFQYSAANVRPDNMDWVNWTLANISNTTPTSLTVGTISGSPFCAGSSVSVPFTAAGINAGNTYTAQLSDASGSFASPTTLGTLVSNATSGTISGTIPTGTGTGTSYRIRVTASNPSTTSTDNGSNLTINAKPSASITSFTDINCFGNSTGSATVTASGGTPSYSYSWSPSGGTGATASSLPAGTYTVTVQDSKGCQATASQTLSQPASALTGSASVTDVSCFGGNNGVIDLTPSGGTAGYSYNWGGGVTTQDRVSLAAGTYGVSITDSKGCQFTIFPISVNQPSASVSGSTVVTNVSCFNGTNGAINLTPAGGTSPYTFNWGGGVFTEDRTGLAAGTYSVTITDNRGCTAVVSGIQVGQPSAAVSGTTVVTSVACFGGSNGAINLTPAGGTSPYTFNWGGGVFTEDRTGLVAGTYSVTITDNIGCVAVVSGIQVGQPSAPVSGTTVVTNVSCFGGSNGAINLTPSGGTSPYTFQWNNGAPTEDRTGLVAGTYSVTITDNIGCTGVVSGIQVSQPSAPVSGTTVVTNVSCFGGSNGAINLTPTGGTSPYTFQWNNGAVTEDRTGLVAANDYSVIITDANGCTGSVSGIVVAQPSAPVSGTTVVTTVSCFGGSNGAINLTPAGGTSPYTFNWGGGVFTEDRTGLAAGTYSVTITDNNGCTAVVSGIQVGQPSAPVSGSTVVTTVACFGGSNGAINLTPAGGTAPYTFNWGGGVTSEDRTGLVAGSYTVIITDNIGCTAVVSGIQVSQPSAPVSGTTVVTNVSCFDGSNGAINLTPAGGTSPYTFQWNNGAPTEDRTGLAAGSYTVIITDDIGCTAVVSGIQVGQPSAPVSGTTVVTNVSCFDGSNGAINLTPAGGTSPYTFQWNNGAPTEDRTGLVAGTYSVTITDANGCQATINNIEVTEPAQLMVDGVSSQVVCAGSNTATISFTGNATTYSWTNNNTDIGLAASGSGNIGAFSAQNAGGSQISATIIVTPTSGSCTGTPVSFTITVNPTPATPTVTPFGPTTFCQGGSLQLTSSSASGNQWYLNGSPIGGATDQNYSATATGDYRVVVTASGCSSAASAPVAVTVNPIPPTPTVTASGPATICQGNSLTLTSSSATGNQWLLDGAPIGG
ncbi:MAG: hypothetical protein EOO15_04660, partial [Chitinophagaceae bacterium]